MATPHLRARPLGTAIGIFLSMLSIPCLSAVGDDNLGTPETKRLAEKLQSDWDAQRKVIVTAHLKYRLIESPTSPLPRNEFLNLLETADLVSCPDDLKTVSRRILPPLKVGESRHGDWGDVELWQDGARGREESAHRVQTDAQSIARVSWYRFIPTWSPANIISLEQSDGRILLRTKGNLGYGSNMVIDEATAMVMNMQLEDPKGKLIRERIQKGWTTYPGNVLFPRLYVEANYREGLLSHVLLFVLTDATFNKDIPENVFQAGTPAGGQELDESKFTVPLQNPIEAGMKASEMELCARWRKRLQELNTERK